MNKIVVLENKVFDLINETAERSYDAHGLDDEEKQDEREVYRNLRRACSHLESAIQQYKKLDIPHDDADLDRLVKKLDEHGAFYLSRALNDCLAFNDPLENDVESVKILTDLLKQVEKCFEGRNLILQGKTAKEFEGFKIKKPPASNYVFQRFPFLAFVSPKETLFNQIAKELDTFETETYSIARIHKKRN